MAEWVALFTVITVIRIEYHIYALVKDLKEIERKYAW